MEKKTTSFRVGQVTDIHLSVGEAVNGGIDSRGSFQRVLDDVSRFALDLVVFSGDLTEHSSEREYGIFFEMLQSYKKPWCMIAGNHDSSEDLAEFSPFPIRLEGGDYFYKREVNGFPFFFLDSSKGFVSRRQLDWLLSETEDETREIFLFVHHPPCLCGHLFMDSRYALKNWEEVGRVLDKIPNLHSVFVGHYHSDMTINRGNGQIVYVTPAIQMQLDPDSSEFKILSREPGWRLIEYFDGELSTELRYL